MAESDLSDSVGIFWSSQEMRSHRAQLFVENKRAQDEDGLKLTEL